MFLRRFDTMGSEVRSEFGSSHSTFCNFVVLSYKELSRSYAYLIKGIHRYQGKNAFFLLT